MDTGLHQRTWWVRAAEQATRIAATLAVTQQSYIEGIKPEDVYIEDIDMADAISMTYWHGDELDRLAQRQAAHDDALAAESMVRLLRDRAADPAVKSTDGLVVKTLMAQHARDGASHLRGDTDSRRRVLDLMVEYDIVRPAIKRGRFHVNPNVFTPA